MLFQTIKNFIANIGVAPEYIAPVATFSVATGVIIIALLIFYILFVPVQKIAHAKAKDTQTLWDDRLLGKDMMFYVALTASLSFIMLSIPFTLQLYPQHLAGINKIGHVLMLVVLFFFFNKAINTVYQGLREDEVDMAGISVIRNILVVIIGILIALFIVCEITGKNVMVILGSLGAAAAIISLLFKDDLVGMTAGVRLVANKMVKHNDWIIVPKYNANGRVEDVRLSAVKIRNWDNSISSVPPHVLISDGFQNMEQMLNKGTRQLKKSVNVDIRSVRVMNPDELEDFADEPWTKSINLNTPHPNISLWRRWLKYFISHHELTELEEFCMVKELQTQSEGIPVEIFFFVKCLEWGDFEELQADIMDSILISMQRFDLLPYQFSSANAKVHSFSN